MKASSTTASARRCCPVREPEPWLPPTTTRACARARFLVAHASDPKFIMDWAHVREIGAPQWRRLDDPFAMDYAPWQKSKHPAHRLEELLRARGERRRSG